MNDPLDAINEKSVNYDVPLTVYQAIDYSMLDDTSTDFDVYLQLSQLAANAPSDDIQVVLFEASQIALGRMNSCNDD